MSDLKEFDDTQNILRQVLSVLPPSAPARSAAFALMNAAAIVIAQMSETAQIRAPETFAGLIQTEKERFSK